VGGGRVANRRSGCSRVCRIEIGSWRRIIRAGSLAPHRFVAGAFLEVD
jgi:hypothetical protein